MMKRDVSSLYFGIIVGLSLGFVLCNVVHAEQICPSTLDVEAERCRKQAYRDWHEGMMQDDPGPYRPNTLGPYEGDLFDKQANCYTQMEAAMRAMEPHIDPNPSYWYEAYDGCNTCAGVIGGTFTCSLLACPSGGNEVARLEWELKQARKKEEAAKQRAVALKQWEQAKACWRKP